MTLGEKIREFGIQKYGTLKEFAAALDMTPENLSQFLSGRRNPGNKLIKRLTDAGFDYYFHAVAETYNKTTDQSHNTETGIISFYVENDNIDDSFNFHLQPKRTKIFNVNSNMGFCMDPTLIPGDKIFVDVIMPPRYKDLVVCEYADPLSGNTIITAKFYDREENDIIKLFDNRIGNPPIIIQKSFTNFIYKALFVYFNR